MQGRFVVVMLALAPLAQAFFFGSSERQQAIGEATEECRAKAAAGDCHFYTCFDERHPCSKHNWALSYGWRYCKRYDQERERFTDEGKSFIINSRLCTMQSLLEFYEDEYINCEDSEHAMKDAHAKCERDNGVCNADMVLENKEPLLDIYTLSRRSLVRFLMYIRECGGSELDDFIDWAEEQRDVARPYLESLRDLISDIAEADWGFDEWSIELPELPGLPEMPELPEFEWPDFGLGWSDESQESAEDESVEIE